MTLGDTRNTNVINGEKNKMPYKNIVYAKLEKRLLEDPRWYMLSETSQLNYIKLILTAQATYNRIPTKLEAIRKAFKTNQRLKTLELSLIEIQEAFPKFKKDENFYYFEEFEEKTNYIRADKGNAQGLPKAGTDKEKEKEKEEEKEEEVVVESSADPTMDEVVSYFESFGYTKELGETFYSYYASQDWRTKSGVSIKKNWQRKVIGFVNNQKNYENNNNGKSTSKKRNNTVTKDEYEQGLKNLFKGRT